MIFIPVRSRLNNGKITVNLNRICKLCHIGIVDFYLPSINEKDIPENTIDVTCEQIDSTFWNPKRLLKRVCFDRVERNDYYNKWQAHIIEYHRVDSAEQFLTFHVSRSISTAEGEHNIKFHKFSNQSEDVEIFFTLALKPITDSESKWTCI